MPGDAVLEWFDSHCHLQDEFDRPDEGPVEPHADRLTATIARASEAGVTRLVCVGTGADSSAEAVELARSLRRPGGPAVAEGVSLWATVGLHPHDAVDGVDGLDGLLAAELGADVDPGERVVVGIGECGLDYHYDHSPRPVQRGAFALQIELAHRHGLALVIHTREAWDDTFEVLAAEGVPERTIVHCFTGGPVEARRCLDLGASLSFSGVVTFKNADDVREAVACARSTVCWWRRTRRSSRPCPTGARPTSRPGYRSSVPRWPRSRDSRPPRWPRRPRPTPAGPSRSSDRRRPCSGGRAR